MDVVVTGSSGFIGGALCRSLRSSGHRVLRLVHGDRGPAPEDDEVALWSPRRATIDAAALEGAHSVVHLAGAGIADHRWSNSYKRELLESRTLGTALLTRTLARLARPPGRLLSGSAIGYYGDTADTETSESAPPGGDFLAQLCVEWESAARPAIEAGIATAFLRTGTVLSPDGGALARQLLPFRLGLGGRAGSGGQWQSWISLDDEVEAIRWLLERPDVTGAVNLTAPGPVTNREFTKALGRALRRPTSKLPMIVPRLLFGRELADSLLLTSQRVVPATLLSHGYDFRFPELGAALAHLLD